MGRASIVKPPGNRGCYFYIRQSESEDINVLAYKAAELKSLGRQTSISKDKNSIKWYSSTNPAWDSLYGYCYKDGKKQINEGWLNELTSSSFAMMFLDLARPDKDSCLNIKLGPFKEQKKLILEYFGAIDMDCSFKKNKMIFGRKETDKFLSIVYQDIPNYLLYRIQRYMP